MINLNSLPARKFRTDDSGSSLLEFAFSASLLFTVVFGILDGARLVYTDHSIGSAARDASRYAMVRGSTWKGVSCATIRSYNCAATASDVTNYAVNSSLGAQSTTPITVTTTWTGTGPTGAPCDTSSGSNGPGCLVTVKVSYAFSTLIPFFPKKAFTLSSTSAVAIAQ